MSSEFFAGHEPKADSVRSTRSSALSRDPATVHPLRAALMAALPGIAVGIATITFIVQLPYVYQLFTPETSERADEAAALGTGPLPEAFLGACVLLGAVLIGYYGIRRPAASGTLLGAAAALTEQAAAGLGFPPFVPSELAVYLLVALPCGWIGGMAGGHLAEQAATGISEQAKAMLAMARAADADAVAVTVSKALKRARPVEVGVWRIAPEQGAEVPPADGAWRASDPTADPSGQAAAPWPATLLRASAEASLENTRTFGQRSLGPEARAEWSARGVGSLIVMPLLRAAKGSKEGRSGLLLVAFADSGRARRLALRLSTRRGIESLASAAAMALEKNESQRQAGAAQERGRRDREWAGEVHDTLIQYFNGVIRSLEGLEKAEARKVPEAAAEARAEAQQTAREGLAEARDLIVGKGPRSVLDRPLPESLSVTAASVLRGTGVDLETETRGEPRPLSDQAEHDLLRVAQEALQNVAKHSGASRARVLLTYGPGRVTLEISDDGMGLRSRPPDAAEGYGNRPEGLDGGFGLRNMRDRVENHCGSLRIECVEDGGMRVVAEVPA